MFLRPLAKNAQGGKNGRERITLAGPAGERPAFPVIAMCDSAYASFVV